MSQEYLKIETLYDRNPDHFVDEDRIRCPEFNQIAHWLVTEKVDGTNIRVALESPLYFEDTDSRPLIDWRVHFYGRTERAQIPTFLLAHLQDTFNWEKLQNLWRGKNDCPKCHGGGQYDSGEPKFFTRERLGQRAYQCECVEPYPITLYGEGYGARIQKGGGSYRTGVSFRLFDVRVANKWWLDWASVKDVAEKLGIETVPSLGIAMTGGIVEMVKHGFGSVVALQDGGDKSYLAEGIVARTDPYLFDKHGRPLRFKLKTKDFDSKNGKGG